MMRAGSVLGVLVLASCAYMPGQQTTVAPDRVAGFVALVEQSDCRFDPTSHPSLHDAGFTDPEMSVIGGELVADGRAEVTDEGVLVLVSGNCV